LNDKKKSNLIYTIVGIVVGYFSFWVTSSFETNLLQPFIAILILFLMAEILRIGLKINKKFKWFLSNGGWVYLFVWFITWIIFYNL
jgi:hypothetical protein